MERLRYRILQSLESYDGLDMMDSLSITVIEDGSILDDASTCIVRESMHGPRAFQAMGRHCTIAGATHSASLFPALPVLRVGERRSVGVYHLPRTGTSRTGYL
ncbi:hypothetical protein K432DRAFT_401124 [Lepidopterella palustris CBS 459.81]|uniref:Uncharacterized protein n=1 Tax=Lepidopterella palustris CBS 459.81 TaxID=1314670 RepID=A0A8E2EI82_9PEZI|nr:hypothetical protein K432DRAFT_401124 [Lepidopterella palustris CBS 459.81]